MAGLPLEPDGLARDLVEHHFPSLRAVGDVPPRTVPSAAHIAILKSDPDTFVLSDLGEVTEHLLVNGHAALHRVGLDRTREAADHLRVEELASPDRSLPVLRGALVLERVAIDTEATDHRLIAEKVV